MSDSNIPPPPAWERIAWWSGYAMIGLAVFSGFFFVYCFGVNLFWWDEWDVPLSLFRHYDDGTLTPGVFWMQHNEHRIPFPKLILFGLGILSRGNTLIYMVFTEVLLASILAIFIAAFRKQFTRPWMIWLMVPPAFLVFCLRQYENMLWGFQIGFVMVVAAGLFAFLCLSWVDRPRWAVAFAAAVTSAIVSAFSSIPGLLVWPVGLGQLLIAPIEKGRKILLASLWTVCGLAVWLAYFHNYVKPAHHPRLRFLWEHFLILVGGSVAGVPTWTVPAVVWAGGFILAMAVAAVVCIAVKRQWGEQAFWLATLAFSLGILGSVTLGRSGFGFGQAFSPRYATFSIPLLVATYVVLISQHRKNGKPAAGWLTVVLPLAMVFGTVTSFSDGWNAGRYTWLSREYQRFVICTLDAQPDEIIQVFPPERLREIRPAAAMMKKMRLNVFSDPAWCERYQIPDPALPKIEEETRCGLDGFSLQAKGEVVRDQGWAVDWPARDLAGGVAVELNGVAYPAMYGMTSEAAVAALGDIKYLKSGFWANIPTKDIPSGVNVMTYRILTRDRKAVFAQSEKYPFKTD